MTYDSYDARAIEIIAKNFHEIESFTAIKKAAEKSGDFYHTILAYIFNEAKGYESVNDFLQDLGEIVEDAFWYCGPDWYEDHGYRWEKESHWYWEE